MSHAMHADVAGYDIPAEERLDFDEVIGRTAPLTEYVLYAVSISKEDTSDIINQMKDLFTGEAVGNATNALIGNIDTSLSKTNSNQFYLGAEAQKNIGNMNAIGENITALSNYSSQLDVAEIEGLIQSYNDNLLVLKQDARRCLLEQAANEFNAKKEEWPDFPKTKTYRIEGGAGVGNNGATSPENDTEFRGLIGNDNEVYEYEFVDGTGYWQDLKDADGNVIPGEGYHVEKNTYRIHKYKYIKCNWGSRVIKSPWDPSFEEIEAQFDLVGCPVPYDRTHPQVLASAESNWGIRRKGHYYN